MDFVILPTQLFDIKYLDKTNRYIIYEHPHYFESYNYNKKKIILHKASMEYYYDYLKSNKFDVEYIELGGKFDIKEYKLFDPVDDIKLTGKYEKIDSPNFLLTRELMKEYRDKTDKFFFHAFFNWSKKQLDIIPNVKSTDKDNRNKLPDNIDIPEIPNNNSDQKYIKRGIDFVNKKFNNNYGNTDDFLFPVTHSTGRRWLTSFIKNKLRNFGKYQDSISTEYNFMFHSVLSSSINIGLINPDEIIDKIIDRKNIEAYIRQLFWREYQRYCYIYYNFGNKNYLGNRKKLTKDWYDGTLGIPPVDKSIKNAFDNGYLHHIERLMIIGNYMNISEIHPNEGFRWFMEFSCDSYEWVMHQNVLDMVFFVTGGDTMRRPYISSSNYILKMSDYSKGEWCDTWDDLYYNFAQKNKRKLWKFRYYIPVLKN